MATWVAAVVLRSGAPPLVQTCTLVLLVVGLAGLTLPGRAVLRHQGKLQAALVQLPAQRVVLV